MSDTKRDTKKDGSYSRNKGRRCEYIVRDHMRKLGWAAERVPSSGAAPGFKGDVLAHKGGQKLLLEVKNYKTGFEQIYALYDTHRAEAQDDVLSLALPHADYLCCDISTSLNAVFDSDGVYTLPSHTSYFARFKRTFGKIANLQKLLGQADVLVLRGDRKPLLFVRFR